MKDFSNMSFPTYKRGKCTYSTYFISQSRQSAKFFLQSLELVLPQPLTCTRVCPPPFGGGHWLRAEEDQRIVLRKSKTHDVCCQFTKIISTQSWPIKKVSRKIVSEITNKNFKIGRLHCWLGIHDSQLVN